MFIGNEIRIITKFFKITNENIAYKTANTI